MSHKFRKRPIVIEAHRWFKNGDHPKDDCPTVTASTDMPALGLKKGEQFQGEGKVVRYFRHPDVPGTTVCRCGNTMHEHGWIDTLEGGHTVCPGDWVVTGVRGERYPVKPDIFVATYEPAGMPPPPSDAFASQARHIGELTAENVRLKEVLESNRVQTESLIQENAKLRERVPPSLRELS